MTASPRPGLLLRALHYGTLILATHAAALGCAAPVSPGGPGDEGEAKIDEARPGPVACNHSFECPLDQMCGASGLCEDPGALMGQRSPAFADVCESPENRYSRSYLRALTEKSELLYGQPGDGQEGALVRGARADRALVDEARERGVLGAMRDSLRTLAATREVARSAVAHYDDELLPTARIVDFALTRQELTPGAEARVESMHEVLMTYGEAIGLYVVEQDEDGLYRLHGDYGYAPEERPVVALDALGRPVDQRYYVTPDEMVRYAESPIGLYGVSRLGQVLLVMERDARTAEGFAVALDRKGEVLDRQGPLGVPLATLISDDSDLPEAYWATELEHILDERVAEAQALAERYFRAYARWDAYGDGEGVVDFWLEHPEARLMAMAEDPSRVEADCDLLAVAGTSWQLWARRALGALALLALVLSGFSIVVTLLVVALLPRLGDALDAAVRDALAWDRDPSGDVRSVPHLAITERLLRAITAGTLSARQAATLAARADGDPGTAGCILGDSQDLASCIY